MTTLLSTTLFVHIIFGIIGVCASYALWMVILKKEPKIQTLKICSLGSLVSILISWLAGGYYYLLYYGSAVKGVIKKGPYPWAHGIVMEAKEHIFLFLPFLLLVIVLVIYLGGTSIEYNQSLKRRLTFLIALTTLIGIAITFSGIAISGAVRQ